MSRQIWLRMAALPAMLLTLNNEASAATATGIVSGKNGPTSGIEVVLRDHNGDEFRDVTNNQGHFSITAQDKTFAWIRAQPGGNKLGSSVHWPDLSTDREFRLTIHDKVRITATANQPTGVDVELCLNLQDLARQHIIGDWQSDQTSLTAEVAAGAYAITQSRCWGSETRQDRYFSYLAVDASGGNQLNLKVPLVKPAPVMASTQAPDASRIRVSKAGKGGIATITGLAGATPGASGLRIVNLQTGHYTRGVSKSDGSFAIKFFAPPGSYLDINQDQTGFIRGNPMAAGTIISVPPGGDPKTAFATLGRAPEFNSSFEIDDPSSVGLVDEGQIWLSGNLSNRNWEKNLSLNMNGKLKIYSHNAPEFNPDDLRLHGRILLERVIAPNGTQELANPEFASHLVTPTGQPIERRSTWRNRGSDSIQVADITFSNIARDNDRGFKGSWQAQVHVPDYTPDGVYQLVIEAYAEDMMSNQLHFEEVYSQIFDKLFTTGGTGLVTVGNVGKRKLSWALGLNDQSNGSRGTVAFEDRERLALATRVSTTSKHMILPMVDEETGTPLKYRLEPFLPLVSASNRGWMTPPTIPFKFPSGNLKVEIEQPDGKVVSIARAAFRQAHVQEPSGGDFQSLSGVSNTPSQYYSLTTNKQRFNHRFTQYGLHKISMKGNIKDIWGKNYTGGGNYEVYIARTLDLETGVFPNTPFQVGDTFAPTLIVQPGVPAQVQIEITHYPNSNSKSAKTHIIEGTANRFGYFQPKTSDALVLNKPGEYRVDYTARYIDEQGRLWMGSQTWASVVATPNSPIVTHGSRNYDRFADTRQQWLRATDHEIDGTHLPFPYQTGDIAWMVDTPKDRFFTAMVPHVTLQDKGGELENIIKQRKANFAGYDLDARARRGELPLFSSTPSGLSPSYAANNNSTHWGYLYAGAARPGVRIREMVSENDTQNAYWRFDDTYNFQLGVGSNGDLPNDFKFQFGGAVYRAPNLDFYYYGATASLWVLLPDNDKEGTRLMPPFQGNGGGPSGGPIMRLKGKDIDMFFHPTGTRPGTIMEVGDVASFSGQLAPTLPSKVKIKVRKPDGDVISIAGTANDTGYFYRPAKNFTVDQPGVYEVSVSVTHTSRTSAGKLQKPYPRGSVLGSRGGKFKFYVVDPLSSALEVDAPPSSWRQPGKEDIAIKITNPGLENAHLYTTTTMPGFILEDRQGQSLSYNYSAKTLNKSFPNLDISDSLGRTGVDTVTMNFFLTGKDANGEEKFYARQILLQGEELMAPLQPGGQ